MNDRAGDEKQRGDRKHGRRDGRPRSGVRRFGGKRHKGRSGGKGPKRKGHSGKREERPRRTDDDGKRVRYDNEKIGMPREVVLPGEVLGKKGLRAGRGAFMEGDTVYAAQLGVKAVSDDYVAVIPLAGRYMPKAGDEVIGMIVDIMPNIWLVEINSPYNAPLYADETPWNVSYGETGRFLTVGDLVLAEVKSVDFMKRINLSMAGRGLRRLSGGQVIQVSHSKVPRIIGKGGSMIRLLKDRTGCRVHVGQNGRIWLEGAPNMIRVATEAIRVIERDAHIHGLTEKIGKYLDELLSRDKAEDIGDKKGDAKVEVSEEKEAEVDAPEPEPGPVPKEGE